MKVEPFGYLLALEHYWRVIITTSMAVFFVCSDGASYNELQIKNTSL